MSFWCLHYQSNCGKVSPERCAPAINTLTKNSMMSSTEKLSSSSVCNQSLSANSRDYQCLKQIGTGFGDLTTIWLARYKDCPKNIVIKKTYLDISDNEKIDLVRHDVHVSRILAHPNILPSLGAFVCGNELWTMSPFMEYGSCSTILEAGFPDGLPEAAIGYILRDVLRALDNIHRMGYIHRAVKGSHILISEGGTVRLCGLRESHCLSPNGYNHSFAYDFPRHAVTNLPWLAPEVLEQNILGYDYRSDIYSVGITAVELAYGIIPYDKLTASQVLLTKLQDVTTLESFLRPSATSGGSSSPGPAICDSGLGGSIGVSSFGPQDKGRNKKFSQAFQQFVNLCLQKKPDNRPPANVLLSHSFFKQTKKKTKETLPELLLPVLPRACKSNELDVDPTVAAMTTSLDQLTVESWTF